MQPRKSRRSRTCTLGTCSKFKKNYLTFIHIKMVKININKVKDKIVILSFYIVSSFFYYFGINRNIINLELIKI